MPWLVASDSEYCFSPKENIQRRYRWGLPWPSCGQDSALPLQGVWVWSPVRELRSRMLQSVVKTNKQNKKQSRCRQDQLFSDSLRPDLSFLVLGGKRSTVSAHFHWLACGLPLRQKFFNKEQMSLYHLELFFFAPWPAKLTENMPQGLGVAKLKEEILKVYCHEEIQQDYLKRRF